MPYADPEKRKAYMKEYLLRTGHVEKERQRYRDNPEYREKQKAYRKANLENYKQYQRNARMNNPRRALLIQAKSRAKRAGLPFDISVETLHWPTHCPVFGFELDYNITPPGERGARDKSATLDRKVCELGYVQGNVFVISHRANRCKSNCTSAELEALWRYSLALP